MPYFTEKTKKKKKKKKKIVLPNVKEKPGYLTDEIKFSNWLLLKI